MKKGLFLLLFVLIATMGFAQEDKTITDKLKSKYHLACYHDSQGGWYSIRACSDGKTCSGACDLSGNEIVPPIYDDVFFRGDYYEVKLNGKVAIRDLNNRELLPFRYEDVSWHQIKDYGYCNVKQGGKVGVVDKQGNEIVKPKYDNVAIYNFKDSDYANVTLNGKTGVVDKQDKEIISCRYTYILYNAGQKMFDVCLGGTPDKDKFGLIYNGQWGVFDKNGKNIIPCKYTNKSISYFFYVGDYARVCIGGTTLSDGKVRGGKWGIVDKTGNLIIPCQYDGIGTVSEGVVPINIGGNFEANQSYWDYICNGGKWGYIDLKGNILIEPKYDKANSFKDGVAQVSLSGQTTLIENPLAKGKANIAGLASDVDVNIPVTEAKNEETFAFIFANEHYDKFSVPFAGNDGKIFKEYCTKTLGVPEKNIRFYENATIGNMRSVVNRIKEVADAYDGDARFIIYYSGQGITDDNTKIPYLLPVDASLNNLSATGYSMETLNSELSELSAKSVWFIVDACFDGTDKEGKMLVSARGVAVKQKNNRAEGNLILFSATSGSETAYAYKEKNHGLFTYFLLKKLQETKGDITGKALVDYVTAEVKKQSVSNTNIQSPSVIVSEKLTNWQTLKIK